MLSSKVSRCIFNINKKQLTSFAQKFATKTKEIDAEANSATLLTQEDVDETSVENNLPPIRRDRSGLHAAHRNMLHEKVPYLEAHSWIHNTEKYQRKIYGRFGAASGVNPSICFPTAEDAAASQRYNAVAEPFTLAEMLAKAKAEEAAKIEAVRKREDDVAKKMEKLEQWKAELIAKVAKKEAEAMAAKQRKERLVEEVRRHFGYEVDPREDRFKEMLAQKEKEDKKKQKEAKRKAKDEQILAKLVAKTA